MNWNKLNKLVKHELFIHVLFIACVSSFFVVGYFFLRPQTSAALDNPFLELQFNCNSSKVKLSWNEVVGRTSFEFYFCVQKSGQTACGSPGNFGNPGYLVFQSIQSGKWYGPVALSDPLPQMDPSLTLEYNFFLDYDMTSGSNYLAKTDLVSISMRSFYIAPNSSTKQYSIFSNIVKGRLDYCDQWQIAK